MYLSRKSETDCLEIDPRLRAFTTRNFKRILIGGRENWQAESNELRIICDVAGRTWGHRRNSPELCTFLVYRLV